MKRRADIDPSQRFVAVPVISADYHILKAEKNSRGFLQRTFTTGHRIPNLVCRSFVLQIRTRRSSRCSSPAWKIHCREDG